MNSVLYGSLIVIGMIAGHILTESQYKAAAVERGYAEYNNVSGEWGWK